MRGKQTFVPLTLLLDKHFCISIEYNYSERMLLGMKDKRINFRELFTTLNDKIKNMVSVQDNIIIISITVIQFIITCSSYHSINQNPSSFYISFFFTATYEVCYFNKETTKLIQNIENGILCYRKGKFVPKPYGKMRTFGLITVGMSVVAYIWSSVIATSTITFLGYNAIEIFNLVCLVCMGIIVWNQKIVMIIREMINKPKYELKKMTV